LHVSERKTLSAHDGVDVVGNLVWRPSSQAIDADVVSQRDDGWRVVRRPREADGGQFGHENVVIGIGSRYGPVWPASDVGTFDALPLFMTLLGIDDSGSVRVQNGRNMKNSESWEKGFWSGDYPPESRRRNQPSSWKY
jgi:hypothetical protein